jgi:hypothetical protein
MPEQAHGPAHLQLHGRHHSDAWRTACHRSRVRLGHPRERDQVAQNPPCASGLPGRGHRRQSTRGRRRPGSRRGACLALITAVLLVLSIVPTAGEVVSILLFGAISLLFLVAWFAVALAFSTVTRESGNALIFTLVIFFVISSLLPVLGAMVGDAVAGPPPQRPESPQEVAVDVVYVSSSTGESSVHRADSRQQVPAWNEALRDYQEVPGGVYREEEICHQCDHASLAAGELPDCGRYYLCTPEAIASGISR